MISTGNHHTARILPILSIVFLLSSTFLAAAPTVVKADPATHILYVDTADDYDFGPTGEAACADDAVGAGDCSLRGAIARANHEFAIGDTEVFVINMDAQMPDGGVFYLNVDNNIASAPGEDESLTGDLDIHGKVQIIGKITPGAIVIDARDGSEGPSLDRIFDIHPGAEVEISGVTIQSGLSRAFANGHPEPGGGIRNRGTLVITNAVVQNNSTSNGVNSAGGYGGGIYNNGTLTAINLRVENNLTGAGMGSGSNEGGGGGGVFNDAAGNLNMQSSTIIGNHTGAGGPAYYGGAGGGLYNSHIAVLNAVDFESNSTGDGAAGSPSGGSGGEGGAIFNNNQGDIKIQGGNFTLNRTGKGGLGINSVDPLNGGRGGDGGMGGAISNLGTISTLQNATFGQNETGAGGDCSFYLNNSGVAGNGGSGGAISSGQYGQIGDETETPVIFTMENNHTGAGGKCDGTGIGGHGGGLYNWGVINSPLQDVIIQNNLTGAGGAALAESYIEGGDGGDGGGIYNKGIIRYQGSGFHLGIDRAIITGNRTGVGGAGGYGPVTGLSNGGDGGDGGGIFNSGDIATIRYSTLEENHTGSGFGSFSTNDSATGGNGGNGGAIYNSGGISEISYSLLLGNYTGSGGDSTSSGTSGVGGFGGNGGAIALYSSGRISRLFNSTVTGNYTGMGGRGTGISNHRSGGNGGAIYSQESGWIDVRMSTIVDNKTSLRSHSVSDPTDISPAGHGGGLYVLGANLFSVVGSIISDNFREIPGGATWSDCSKMPGDGLQSLGYNVIRHPVSDYTVAEIDYQCNVFVVSTGKFGPDVIGQDPLLTASDPIQYFTPAYDPDNPTIDSPAIDLVPMQSSGIPLCGILDSELDIYIDQRGNHRPVGSRCDAGSIEIGGSGSENTVFLPAVRKQ